MIDATPPKRRRREPLPPRPACPVHGVMLVIESTRKKVRYAYCPIDGCKESACLERQDAETE